MDDTSDHQWSQYNQGRILGLGQIQAPPPAERRTACNRPHQHQKNQAPLNCPRCDSTNTKFCYYNNYSLSQPRYFCKTCRRYWTAGGTLRNVPVGGGSRKNKKILSSSSASTGNAINIPPAFYKLDQAGGASQFGPEPQLGSLFGGGSFGLVRELIMGGPAAAAGDKAGVVQLGDPTFFWNGGAGNIGGSCMNVFSQD